MTRIIPRFTIYPNQPTKLRTGLALIREHVLIRRSSNPLCCYVRFDTPTVHVAVLLVRTLEETAEYIDPLGSDCILQQGTKQTCPREHFEAVLCTICKSMQLLFYSTRNIFGLPRYYATKEGHLFGRTFPAPASAVLYFLSALRRSQNTTERRELNLSLDSLVSQIEDSDFRVFMQEFWGMHIATKVCEQECLVKDWIQNQSWYGGGGKDDYMIIGARITQYYLHTQATE